MGRTNPTYRDALRAIEERWTDFRRALRRRDQPRFDQLFEYAREHADASGLLNHQNPLLPALISIDLEQEARLDEHEDRLAELENALNEADDRQQHSEAGTTEDGLH
ncbi:unknown (plasmid) [Haloarcula marismortui ATCC 43049]|jgi:hypothetical protein|uniref:DUF8156 domain-containing protein n=2 Tax=Halobacteriales TaxID=2235 RepID=Q5V7B6_HALMA|nr:hypothetical protein [Haloarcula marismortui]AAV44713.1 unknown [Haloarcula marismortui ATCC 43049]QCP89577.1 hypothetical protein E6P14_01215 [Haloarcula marismortui ATCC 43049]